MPTFTGAQLDPNRGFRVWAEDEIYRLNHDGYVPNVGDLVVSLLTGFKRVTEVNYTTGISQMVSWRIPDINGVTGEDILLGAGPGHVSESYRIYLDENVFPHTLTFDGRLKIHGTAAREVKIFRGADIGPDGDVVSRLYDQGGQLLGENIPMETVLDNVGVSQGYKVPVVGHTVADIQTGELLTAVVFNDEGSVLSITSLLAERTGYVRRSQAAAQYVVDVRIESPYLDVATDELQVPINVPLSNIAMEGVVTYSDGRVVRVPIDGTKMRVDGLNNYVSTVVNQTVPVVLKYTLAESETNYTGMTGSEHHVARSYTVRSIQVDGAHTVKLFTYPSWNPGNSEYELKHWLVNLDRNICRDVTPFVTITQQSNPFNPNRYGVIQNMSFVMNLKDAMPALRDYQHVQTVGISLIGPGTDNGTLWTSEFSPEQNPPYGWGLEAKMEFVNAGNWRMTLDSGETSRVNWLSKVYRNLEPLYDENVETYAPEPTHFRVQFKNTAIEYGIGQWDAEMIVPNDYQPGETLIITFIRRLVGQDLMLGVAGMSVKHV